MLVILLVLSAHARPSVETPADHSVDTSVVTANDYSQSHSSRGQTISKANLPRSAHVEHVTRHAASATRNSRDPSITANLAWSDNLQDVYKSMTTASGDADAFFNDKQTTPQFTTDDSRMDFSSRSSTASSGHTTQTQKRRFVMEYTTPTQGIVRTPTDTGDWSIEDQDDGLIVAVPPGRNKVFITFSRFTCNCRHCAFGVIKHDEISTNKTGDDNFPRFRTELVIGTCNKAPKDLVFTADKIRFLYQHRSQYPSWPSIKLFLSFHEVTAGAPQRLSDGRWNCSVPNLRDFAVHIAICDFISNCLGSEDEVGCPYEGHCGPGYVTIGEGCCKFLKVPQPAERLTWSNADLTCRAMGGHLVSLNTPKEWDDFTQFFVKQPDLAEKMQTLVTGLRHTTSSIVHYYRKDVVWADGTVAYFASYTENMIQRFGRLCAVLELSSGQVKLTKYCQAHMRDYVIPCEFPTKQNETLTPVQLPKQTWKQKANFRHVVCPRGHVTLDVLACDLQSACWVESFMSDVSVWGTPSATSCPARVTLLPPMFACANGYQHVAYSLVCNHRADCTDASDENFCHFRPCGGDTPVQCTRSKQCVSLSAECDGQPQCVDGTDEARCGQPVAHDKLLHYTRPRPPAVVHFQRHPGPGSQLTYTPVNASELRVCPESHFQCAGNGYCLPVFLRCNGVSDCPGREDEAGCDGYTCPGFYRCRASRVCLHGTHVCDGTLHCPQQDDELFCDVTCPGGCTCHGLALTCNVTFAAGQWTSVRYLDGRGSMMTLGDLANNTMLVHLSLGACHLRHLHPVHLPNLLSLDLSHNRLNALSLRSLQGLPQLKVLSLAGNPLTSAGEGWLLKLGVFQAVDQVQHLNLSACGVERLAGNSSRTLGQLRVLDVRGCALTHFPPDVVSGLPRLQRVFADNYKLCCPLSLPPTFDPKDCEAPFDEISSCEALLRSDAYRVVLCAFSAIALVGNVGSLVFRLVLLDVKRQSGNSVFVSHLCVSDFLMGLYLAIIGVADRLYRGTYLWEDTAWRHSLACRVAGVVSLLSSEVSVLMVCLITLDRFLALRFPFSSLHFSPLSAHCLSALAWLLGALIIAVPLLPVTSHWRFYSQTGICLPLPITRSSFAGHAYAFAVVIVVNFALFLLIAAGQASIYLSIRANSMALTDSSRKWQDLAIARRLLSIAVSDFLCWFPVGLLGLLATKGVAVPGEANVALAILVLPLNSVLNPFLYNLNLLLERRRQAQENRLLQQLLTDK